MSDPNAKQVGGAHYRTGGVQHWDVMDNYDIPYLEGNATKYLVRWRKKDVLQGLEKAGHYLEKIMAQLRGNQLRRRPSVPFDVVREMCQACDCDQTTTTIVQLLLMWGTMEDLGALDLLLQSVIENERRRVEHPAPFGFDRREDV